MALKEVEHTEPFGDDAVPCIDCSASYVKPYMTKLHARLHTCAHARTHTHTLSLSLSAGITGEMGTVSMSSSSFSYSTIVTQDINIQGGQ